MSTVLEHPLREEKPYWLPWLAIGAGLLLLYVPTYLDLARGLWRDDEYAHGPIVVALFAWLVWRGRGALADASSRPAPILGFIVLACGLLVYVAGRALALTAFEVASHIPVIAGALLVVRGPRAVRRLAFPLLFLFFLIPLPGFVLETAATPLKSAVSAAVAVILQAIGYPVVRSGVVLEVGDHQMLVADACSGLNSLVSLTALVFVYLHLTGPSSRWRWLWVLASIAPIAVVANIVRVLILVLITYHYGEEAAQSFLHGFAGMVVFITALVLVLGVDRVVRGQLGPGPSPHVGAGDDAVVAPDAANAAMVRGTITAILAAVAMAGAAIAAPMLKPVPMESAGFDLERAIPATFAGWRIDPELAPIAPAPDVQAKLDRIYRQVVSRTYVNDAGERIMLTAAYGGDQSDALKAHRQEVCYTAQGFEIRGLDHGRLSLADRSIPVTRMVAVRGDRVEPVTYWLTMGDRVVLGRAERLQVQVASGLAGRIPDGMMVRVSSISDEAPAAFSAQRDFVVALVAAIDPAVAERLAGRH